MLKTFVITQGYRKSCITSISWGRKQSDIIAFRFTHIMLLMRNDITIASQTINFEKSLQTETSKECWGIEKDDEECSCSSGAKVELHLLQAELSAYFRSGQVAETIKVIDVTLTFQRHDMSWRIDGTEQKMVLFAVFTQSKFCRYFEMKQLMASQKDCWHCVVWDVMKRNQIVIKHFFCWMLQNVHQVSGVNVRITALKRP